MTQRWHDFESQLESVHLFYHMTQLLHLAHLTPEDVIPEKNMGLFVDCVSYCLFDTFGRITWCRLHSGSCLSAPISCATTAGTFHEQQSPCDRPRLQRWNLHRGGHDKTWMKLSTGWNVVGPQLTWSAKGFESHAWLCTYPAKWLQNFHTLTPPKGKES